MGHQGGPPQGQYPGQYAPAGPGYGAAPMIPPSGAAGPYGSGPVVLQQGAGSMAMGAMQIVRPRICRHFHVF